MDSYKHLLDKLGIDKQQFIEIGLDNFLPISEDIKWQQWEEIKQKAFDSNAELFIRRYGQQGKNTHLYQELYSKIFDCRITQDPNNNTYPTRTLNNHTDYRKNSKSKKASITHIYNYQISHLFGRTKNPLLFTALWNLAYVPKYFDPFTGHESKGDIAKEIGEEFKIRILNENNKFINDYNAFVTEKIIPAYKDAFLEVCDKHQLTANQMEKFKKDSWDEIRPIGLDTIIDN
ncbi:MAG: hypothetical protein IT221_03540 [Fluviicola sp.]|nr:hypothetical protein [Fluviicola sp.]